MASILKVDKLDPQSGTALEIGTSGDTITVPSGASLTLTDSTLSLPTTINTDKLDPKSGTALELGSSGDTITIPSGATFTQSGTMNASAITAGTIATARLGTGTASSSTVLYGDQTYKAEPGGGKVLQFVWVTPVTANQDISTTTWTDVTGMTLDITPSATSSKIFVFAQTVVYFQEVGSDTGLSLRIDRDASVITSDIGGGYGVYSPSDTFRFQNCIMFYDEPSSTSALTYKIQAKTYLSRDAELHESKDGYMYAYEIGA